MAVDVTPDFRPLNTQWSPVSIVASQPLWSREIHEQLMELTQLPENWDSYGSSPVKPEVITLALDVLARLSRFIMTRPHVLAVPGGGVQFEWANNCSELEVEIRPDKTVEFLIIDQDEEMLEGAVEQGYSGDSLYYLSNWFLNEKESVEQLFRPNVSTC